MRIPLAKCALNMYWKTGPAPGDLQLAQGQKDEEITSLYGEEAEC